MRLTQPRGVQPAEEGGAARPTFRGRGPWAPGRSLRAALLPATASAVPSPCLCCSWWLRVRFGSASRTVIFFVLFLFVVTSVSRADSSSSVTRRRVPLRRKPRPFASPPVAKGRARVTRPLALAPPSRSCPPIPTAVRRLVENQTLPTRADIVSKQDLFSGALGAES